MSSLGARVKSEDFWFMRALKDQDFLVLSISLTVRVLNFWGPRYGAVF